MHDPLTVAFEINYPWKGKPTKLFPKGYRKPLITIWHVDPAKHGDDDSCGWFPRSRHGDKRVLEKIIKRYDFDWDRVFESESGRSYNCGFFKPDGIPNFSVHGIVLNLFFLAAHEVLGDRKRALKFIQGNLAGIMLFAENPTDSIGDSITLKYGNDELRRDRIENLASCVYGWILRQTRPWWKHPRWHFWHWKLQIHPFQLLWRFLFVRCSKCHGRFKYGETPIGTQSGNAVWHSKCDESYIK